MVTYKETARTTSGKLLIKEGNCRSTDTKPIENIANGSMLMEMDTSTLYLFDEESHTWRAWS